MASFISRSACPRPVGEWLYIPDNVKGKGLENQEAIWRFFLSVCVVALISEHHFFQKMRGQDEQNR